MDPHERRVLWLMASPFLVGVSVLVLIPALGSFAMAAYEWDLVRLPRFVGLDNFRELVNDPVFRISLRNSLLYALTAVPLRLLFALGLALLLCGRRRSDAAGRVGVLVPTVIPDVAYALVWLWILNPIYGPLNLALGTAGLPTPAWLSQPWPARWSVVLMGVFQLGEAFLIVVAVRRLVPSELHEIAAISGAGRWARLVRITIPIMAPALLLVAMRDTIVSLQSTFLPALLVTERAASVRDHVSPAVRVSERLRVPPVRLRVGDDRGDAHPHRFHPVVAVPSLRPVGPWRLGGRVTVARTIGSSRRRPADRRARTRRHAAAHAGHAESS